MTVTIDPKLEKFIDEQVQAGRFSSKTEAIEAGIELLMRDPELDVLDEQPVDLQSSLDQMDRGEVIDATELHAKLRQKYFSKS